MLNRHSKTFGILATTLLLCDLATLAVLFSRLGTYSTEFKNVIPLTQSTIGGTNAYAGSEDEPKVWFANTSADIFKYSYNDGITVQNDGEKLIYPGTSNEYTFTLENPSEYLLDYELTMVAYITGTDYVLPVDVNVSDYTGKYLVGSEDNKVNVLELNQVDEQSKLSAGRFAVYTLNWEWAYESGNDEYDTMLGNLATNEDITLTIEIHLTSNVDEDDELWRSRLTDDLGKNGSAEFSVEVTEVTEDEDGNGQGTAPPDDANANQNVVVPNNDITELPEIYTTTEPITETSTQTKVQTKSEDQTTDVYGIQGYSTNPKTGDSIGGIALATALTTALVLLTKPKRRHHKEDDV